MKRLGLLIIVLSSSAFHLMSEIFANMTFPVDSHADAAVSVGTRPLRHLSHALVEIGRFRWLPFSAHSAILLDIGIGGFKAEVTGTITIVAGRSVWFKIPLQPWGIYSPAHFVAKAEVRWVDPKLSRLGATFLDLSVREQRILEQIISALTARGDAF